MLGCLLGVVVLGLVVWLPKPVLFGLLVLMFASWLLKGLHST